MTAISGYACFKNNPILFSDKFGNTPGGEPKSGTVTPKQGELGQVTVTTTETPKPQCITCGYTGNNSVNWLSATPTGNNTPLAVESKPKTVTNTYSIYPLAFYFSSLKSLLNLASQYQGVHFIT